MTNFRVTPVGYALGAKVTGLALEAPLDPSTLSSLRRAWLQHLVLWFPDQELDDQAFLRFARQFGPLETSHHQRGDATEPELAYLSNQPRGGVPWNGIKPGAYWHSDDSYTTCPTAATFVLARILPDVGGDTMFANQYMAYETLSPPLKRLYEDLEAVHALPLTERAAEPGERPAVHPLVRVHPETGRQALYAGERVQRILGVAERESRALIDFANQHATRYEFCYRHRWSRNDIIMWDNRALLHIALRDYDEHRQARHMIRAACTGEPSGRLACA